MPVRSSSDHPSQTRDEERITRRFEGLNALLTAANDGLEPSPDALATLDLSVRDRHFVATAARELAAGDDPDPAERIAEILDHFAR